jgi:nucleotide-binding universal stress UspA family protein
MSNVLLMLPPDRQVGRAIATALDLAQQRSAGLIAALVIDTDAAHRLSHQMMDKGLVAEGVTEDLLDALEREHRIRGEAILHGICEQTTARGIPCRTLLETGDPGAVCRRLVEAGDVTAVVLVPEKRSWLGRALGLGGQALRPEGLGGCEVFVVPED